MMLGLRGSTAMVGSTRWRSEKVSPAMSMFRSNIIAAWTVEVDTARVTKTRANAVSSLNSLRLTLRIARYKQDAFGLKRESHEGLAESAESGSVRRAWRPRSPFNLDNQAPEVGRDLVHSLLRRPRQDFLVDAFSFATVSLR